MFALVTEAIDGEAVRALVEHPSCGAVLVFHGTVRNATDARRVTKLEYEAYEPMALSQLETVATAVRSRHEIHGIACTHRLGVVPLGEDAMVVAIAAPHRKAALAATEDFITCLKQQVPIWKKEHFEGGAVWVGTPDDPQGVRSSGRATSGQTSSGQTNSEQATSEQATSEQATSEQPA